MRHSLARLALVFTLSIVIGSPATAALHALSAFADCHQANAGAGTCGSGGSGTGILNLVYDDVSGELTWDLAWVGLSASATAAHLHGPATPGQNAGVVVPLSVPSPSTGLTTISAGAGADLMSGLWYLNVHSSAFPGGEIRGQIYNDPDDPPPPPMGECLQKCLMVWDEDARLLCIAACILYQADSGASTGAATSNASIEPGAQISITSPLGAQLSLIKGFEYAIVDVTTMSVDVDIPSGPSTGVTTFTVTGGGGAFAPYTFGADAIPASTFSVTGGSGTLDWDTGLGEFEITGHVVAAGYADIDAVATGQMQVDFVQDEVTLLPGALAVELGPLVPAGPLAGWGTALVLGLGGSAVLARRVRRRTR